MNGLREALDLDDDEVEKLNFAFKGIDKAGTGQIDYA